MNLIMIRFRRWHDSVTTVTAVGLPTESDSGPGTQSDSAGGVRDSGPGAVCGSDRHRDWHGGRGTVTSPTALHRAVARREGLRLGGSAGASDSLNISWRPYPRVRPVTA